LTFAPKFRFFCHLNFFWHLSQNLIFLVICTFLALFSYCIYKITLLDGQMIGLICQTHWYSSSSSKGRMFQKLGTLLLLQSSFSSFSSFFSSMVLLLIKSFFLLNFQVHFISWTPKMWRFFFIIRGYGWQTWYVSWLFMDYSG